MARRPGSRCDPGSHRLSAWSPQPWRAGDGTAAIVAAVFGQGVALILSELRLLGQGDQLEHGLVLEVAEQVVGFDEVVAGVEIAVVLDGKLQPGRLGVHAHATRLAVPVGQGGVEHLDVDGADVVSDHSSKTSIMNRPNYLAVTTDE
jgi:hypothetical protein